jgi:hypothetical protein
MRRNFGLTDYMGFQELLTDEEKRVRETARNFVNDNVIPIIDEHAQKETFRQHLVKHMGSLARISHLPRLPCMREAKQRAIVS